METMFMFITFETTHRAIAFENLLIDRFAIELIPTPREVTSSCGLALKFKMEDRAAVLEAIKEQDFRDIKLFQYHRHHEKSQAVAMDWREAYAAEA
ncbi:DUF3343 domain-containing protein [Fusibacter paucivorans]|uniref:DUF3343 domain-containing protein n=1 Tax=Fusibacter paucivorans TaxID=76009 RepID=A0ABS5PMZ7_9FIRM|nr:DUF3343 domain-containing protein [Fusibacter paucivorans]MBS7526559.1 DUF3343 domain-containing protein [Fusibacter paucivorans]